VELEVSGAAHEPEVVVADPEVDRGYEVDARAASSAEHALELDAAVDGVGIIGDAEAKPGYRVGAGVVGG